MEKYKIVKGTRYHKETSQEVIDMLEIVRNNNTRIVLDYGDVKTGKSWKDIYGITGYVGRSMGITKIPILLYNSKSIGGGAILDNCIIKISTSLGKIILYEFKI